MAAVVVLAGRHAETLPTAGAQDPLTELAEDPGGHDLVVLAGPHGAIDYVKVDRPSLFDAERAAASAVPEAVRDRAARDASVEEQSARSAWDRRNQLMLSYQVGAMDP